MNDKLLIASFEKLIYWNGKHTEIILDLPERIYSVTWNQDYIFVITGKNILIFDRLWQQQNTISFIRDGKDAHPHQALWHNGLHVVLSGYHSINHYIDTYTSITEWPGKYCIEGTDPHLNSVWYNHYCFYVVEHWRDQLPKRVSVFNSDWIYLSSFWIGKEAFGDRWNGIHNVYIENGLLYTLGPRRIIIKYLLSSHKVGIKTGFDIPWLFYFRGLARTNKAFYVGVSQHNKCKLRSKGDSAILVLDDALKQQDLIILNDTGQIHDVRALTDDKAHNGISCPFKG